MTLQAMLMQLQVTFQPSFCLPSSLRRLWFLRSFQWCRSQRRLVAQQRCNDLSKVTWNVVESCHLRMFQLTLLILSIHKTCPSDVKMHLPREPATISGRGFSKIQSSSALKQVYPSHTHSLLQLLHITRRGFRT